jgi:hypothetical protein
MKKLLTLFAVIALTAPVFAADGDPNVLITIVDEGGGVVQVNYQVLVEDGVDPGLMRGIALKLTTSNTALFDAISDYATGSTPADSTQIPAGYSVFMGSIQFAADPNFVSSFGDPVAPSGDPGAGDDLPDAAEIVVELGSLYAEGGTAPGTSGTLFKLTLDGNGESSTVLGIEGESTRGECVMEDGTQANIVLSAVTDAYKVSFGPTECYVVGNQRGGAGCNAGTITQANYDAWVTAGKPVSWCCPWQPCGDTNGDGYVNPSDFISIVANPAQPASVAPAADTNHDGFINPSDFIAIVAHPTQGNGVPCPPLP